MQDGLGHLLGRDGAVGAAHAGHLEELGGDGARIDAGHLDAVVAQLLHNGLAEAPHTELCGIVGAQVRVADQTSYRGDVDDMAAEAGFCVLFFHLGHGCARAEKDAAQVRVHLHIPVLQRQRIDRPHSAQPRIVDQDVQAAGLANHPLEGRLDVVGPRYVAGDWVKARAQFVAERIQALDAPSQSVHMRAFLHERNRKGPAQPAAGAGHDGHFIPKFHNAFSVCFLEGTALIYGAPAGGCPVRCAARRSEAGS